MKKNGKWIFLLALLVAAIAVIPLFLNSLEISGADDAAGKAVAAVDPNYVPWAKSIIEFTGKNTETLLFCLQAGTGAGILGAGFGYLILRKKNQRGND
jgi:cobalt/nickel transport protein